MVIKLIITLEGSTEEFKPILKFLSEEQAELIDVKKATEQAQEEKTGNNTWTEDKIRKIWGDITVDCKDILLEIAKHEEGISMHQLEKALNLNGNSIGGRLSSLGHQIRINNYVKLPNVFLNPNDNSYGYKLPPLWIQIITKIENEMAEYLKSIEK
jgi:hypothetical protein